MHRGNYVLRIQNPTISNPSLDCVQALVQQMSFELTQELGNLGFPRQIHIKPLLELDKVSAILPNSLPF